MFRRLRKYIFTLFYKIFSETVIEVLFMSAILVIIFFSLDFKDGNFFSKVDLNVFLAVVIAFIVNIIKNSTSKFFRKKIEDYNKLSDDYNQLVKQYPRQPMITYKNANQTNSRLNQKEFVFPVILENILYESKIFIEDTKDQYKLPNIVNDNFETIMQAHEFSDVYNQLNIRLDNFKYDDNLNELTLFTSRTTYFDSLVTNRAMDFKWGMKSSVRDLFGYGPYIDSLSESKLSNHLGFNGFIETSDQKLIFVSRNKNVSIGKGTLGSSIAASLKTMYALNNEKTFNVEGLLKSMIMEINDELKINEDSYEFSTNNIISIYRDIVEGGKPQLLFYVKVNKTSNEVDENFKLAHKKKEKRYLQMKMSMDGNKLVFIDKEKLKDLYITPETVIYDGKSYVTMPSVSAAIVILIKFLKKKREL